MNHALAATTLWMLVAAGGPAVAAGRAADVGPLARRVLDHSGVRGGLIVHVGCGDGRLTAALAEGGNFLVHGLARDGRSLAAARAHLRARGLYGRACVEQLPVTPLPYPEDLVNLLVAGDPATTAAAGPSAAEILRVLVPGGAAWVRRGDGGDAFEAALRQAGAADIQAVRQDGGWVAFRKPPAAGQADWPHHDGGADGRRVSADQVAGPPRRLKWIDAPTMYMTHFSRPEGWVSAGGRVYYVYDERHPRLDGPKQPRIHLVARDARNGVLLWRRPVPIPAKRGRYEPIFLAEAMVATADRLYAPVGPNRSLVALDGATGKVRIDFGIQPRSVRLVGDALIAAGIDLRVLGAADGKLRWRMPVRYCRRMVAGDGKVFTHERRRWRNQDATREEGFGVACYDLKTGDELWWTPQPLRLVCYHAGWIIVASRTHRPTLTGRRIAALAADSGKLAWTYTVKKDSAQDLYCIGERLWYIDQDMRCVGLELKTGRVVERLGSYHRGAITHHFIRCSGTNATERFLITGNTMDFMEIRTGTHLRSQAARSSCGFGIRTANGTVYTFPVDCGCFKSLRGVLGMAPEAPAGEREQTAASAAAPPLVRGPAYGQPPAAPPAVDPEAEWPCYRHDAGRSGGSATRVPAESALLWKAKVGADPTAPTVAGGLALVASKRTHELLALDAASGTVRWRYTAGGPLDSPPTLYNGMCLFGCRNGWVYCLRAADGVLAWRRRIAPRERRIVAFGRIESPTPAWGSVIVVGDTVFATAGYSSELDGGIQVCALDAATGAVRWRQTIPRTPLVAGRRLEKRQLAQQRALGDILVSDGNHVFMRGWRFEPDTGKRRYYYHWREVLKAGRGGFLDATMKTPWSDRQRRAAGQLMVRRGRTTCGFLALEKDGWKLAYFTKVGTGQYTVFGKHFDASGKPDPAHAGWEVKACPVAVEAMLIAGDTLYITGPPDVAEPEGGRLWALSAADGRKRRALRLDAPAVFDGLAAANGRLYASCRDGTLLCFGKP
jgi:outer membrane protein assembly factor BamB